MEATVDVTDILSVRLLMLTPKKAILKKTILKKIISS